MVLSLEKNARCGEGDGERREPVHRCKIGDGGSYEERLDLLARGQGRSIARVVIAIAISFIHLADLAIADIARTLLGGVQIGCRKDELRAGKRGEIAGALPIGRASCRERVCQYV